MIKLIRTNASHKDFKELVRQLDSDLAIRDGEDHTFYHQFNHITDIQHALVAYDQDIPVGCGAVKKYDEQSMEVKRMYVPPKFRGKGIASLILTELEKWTVELNYKKCVLETGKKQPEAIALYQKKGYQIIPNYGQYEGVENSLCFEKTVHQP